MFSFGMIQLCLRQMLSGSKVDLLKDVWKCGSSGELFCIVLDSGKKVL